jgi:hypothetical protein
MSNQDEKDAEEYATSCFDGEDYDSPSQTKLEAVFLKCIQESRKGYIKAEKAIEVVANEMYLSTFKNYIPKMPFNELLLEEKFPFLREAKKKLGIEDE